jgi:hypothetical protein
LGGFGGLGALGGLGNPSTPATYLDNLKAFDGTITVVGTERVRDTTTTHYRGALNMATLLRSAARTPEERAELDAALSFFAQMSLPYDVWIDGEGFPRRLATSFDFASFAPMMGGTTGMPSGVAAPSMVFAYELFDFGKPEAIELPAPSQVTALNLSQFETGALGY